MNRYQAHVTDEWERNTMVIQVRELDRGERTYAIAQVMEDRDGMPSVLMRPLPDALAGREHLEPTPGLRIPHDVAVAMARAILTDAGKDADEVERLKGTVDTLLEDAQRLAQERDRMESNWRAAQNAVDSLERLVEAKDAHLEREARTSDHHHRTMEAPPMEPVLETRLDETDAQRVVHWATEVASSTGRELSEVLEAWERLNAPAVRMTTVFDPRKD